MEPSNIHLDLAPLASYQDICNAPSTSIPQKQPPCKPAVLDYEKRCNLAVKKKEHQVATLSNQLEDAMDKCLEADQDLYVTKSHFEDAEVELNKQNHFVVECDANLSRCHAELAQANLEHDASQTLVDSFSNQRVMSSRRLLPQRGNQKRFGRAVAAATAAASNSVVSPYVMARKKKLGIKMMSSRFARGAPSGDVHKAFMADLKEFLYETEGRDLSPQQIHGCNVDFYRFMAEVLQAGGIEAVIQMNYGLRNIANRLRIGNKVLRAGRSTADTQLKAIYLDTLYQYEQKLCLGKPVEPGKVELLMGAAPTAFTFDEQMFDL